ncbi:MAG: glycosyltransferase [Rhodoferax sp.]|nr:glycosyltransferase [Rhodoferax sp.]
MKILWIEHGQYITVGVAKVIEFAEAVVRKGNRVTFVLTSKTNRLRTQSFTRNGVDYCLSPSLMWGKWRHGADPWDAFRRTLYIRNCDADVIFAGDSRPSVILPSLYYRWRSGAPLVLQWADLYSDGGTITERSSKLYQHTLGHVESFFENGFRLQTDGARVVSSRLADRIGLMGYPPDRTLLLPNGCVIDRSKITNKQAAKNKVGWHQNKIYVGHLGRIYPRDYDLISRAFRIVASDRDDLQLVFVGDVKRPLDHEDNHIIYTGRVDDSAYRDYCNAMDIFVLPLCMNVANMARWPSKIGDYLSYAKPVIATPVSDVPQIYRTKPVGILSDSDSVVDYAAALASALEQQAMWDEWGANALDYAEKYLDWNILADQLLCFFEHILSQTPR